MELTSEVKEIARIGQMLGSTAMQNLKSATLEKKAAHGLHEIRLFVRCHDWAVAFETEWVDRIVPASSGTLETVATQHRGMSGFAGMLRIDEQVMPAWDLGRVLGLQNLDSAWVLMRRGELRMAIRTGACLSVGALPFGAVRALPAGIFVAPDRQYFSGAFDAAAHVTGIKNAMFAGLVFNLAMLWAHVPANQVVQRKGDGA